MELMLRQPVTFTVTTPQMPTGRIETDEPQVVRATPSRASQVIEVGIDRDDGEFGMPPRKLDREGAVARAEIEVYTLELPGPLPQPGGHLWFGHGGRDRLPEHQLHCLS